MLRQNLKAPLMQVHELVMRGGAGWENFVYH